MDDGFVSTTVLKKKVASGNVFMEIDVPPGTGRGAWINPLSGSADKEWEFLLQRGSVFEVTDVSDVGDDIVVKMKWTGIEKKDIEFASREDVKKLLGAKNRKKFEWSKGDIRKKK